MRRRRSQVDHLFFFTFIPFHSLTSEIFMEFSKEFRFFCSSFLIGAFFFSTFCFAHEHFGWVVVWFFIDWLRVKEHVTSFLPRPWFETWQCQIFFNTGNGCFSSYWSGGNGKCYSVLFSTTHSTGFFFFILQCLAFFSTTPLTQVRNSSKSYLKTVWNGFYSMIVFLIDWG